MNKKLSWLLVILTPLFFIITHAIAYLIHEYSHSFSAWIFGFKDNPFNLNYGDTSWQNILLLEKVSENVNYSLFSSAHPWIAAFIAFAGPGIGNGLLFIVSLLAFQTQSIRSSIYYYFFLWFTVMNLGNFIDYIPGRTFSTHGDMGEITSSLGISPWWLMLIFGYPIAFCFWYFYSTLLPNVYGKLNFNLFQQIILLILITFTLFVLFGATGLNGYGPESHLIALLSIYAAPIVVVSSWPQRKWVTEKIKIFDINAKL